MTSTPTVDPLLSLEELREFGINYSRTHIWRLIIEALPAPRQFNPLALKRLAEGWRRSEIVAWLDSARGRRVMGRKGEAWTAPTLPMPMRSA